MRRVSTLVAGVILLGALAGRSQAQVTLDRVVIGSAGGRMSSGAIQVDMTLGQPVIGSSLGASTESDLGFWWQVSTSTTGVGTNIIPTAFALHQNAPNPFWTRTSITYAIPHGPVPVFIGVFNLQGGLVRTLVRESKSPGTFTVTWDGRDDGGRYLAAGVYFTKFQAGSYQRTAKTVMLK